MSHKVVLHQGLYCLLRSNQSLGTEISTCIDILTENPLQYKVIDNSIVIVSICMEYM